MRCLKPCGSTVPASMTSFSKSANACGVQSAGESIDEVIISLPCRDESPRSRTVRAHYYYNLYLSLAREERKSHNLVYMKTKTLSLVLIPLLAYLSASPTSRAVTPPPD